MRGTGKVVRITPPCGTCGHTRTVHESTGWCLICGETKCRAYVAGEAYADGRKERTG